MLRGQAFGPYQLLMRLGQGGMGEVWQARGPGLDGQSQLLVIKRLLPNLQADEEMVANFCREARICARLRHPNIVRLFDSGSVDQTLYLSMEYLPGFDLAQVLRRLRSERRRPPPGLGVYVVREICSALAHAHNVIGENGEPMRLVHRDVTPSNVFLTEEGVVKLLDFGIAKALADTADARTVSGTFKGKFGYMAPEQIEGHRADQLSDQFAVGVVLHETLTGQRLFRGESDMQTIAMVKRLEVPPPSALAEGIPRALDEICLRALSREPSDRFRDAAAMARALDPVLSAIGFDANSAAALLKDNFPNGLDHNRLLLETSSRDAAEATKRQRKSSRSSASGSGRTGRTFAVAGAALVCLGGGGWWLVRGAHRDPAAAIAPAAPANAPVAPAIAPAPSAQPPPAPSSEVPTRTASPTPALAPQREPSATASKPSRAASSIRRRPARESASVAKPSRRSVAPNIRRGATVDPFAE